MGLQSPRPLAPNPVLFPTTQPQSNMSSRLAEKEKHNVCSSKIESGKKASSDCKGIWYPSPEFFPLLSFPRNVIDMHMYDFVCVFLL